MSQTCHEETSFAAPSARKSAPRGSFNPVGALHYRGKWALAGGRVIQTATNFEFIYSTICGGTAPNIFSCRAASTFPEAGLRFRELW
jgi:hypothetical protein